ANSTVTQTPTNAARSPLAAMVPPPAKLPLVAPPGALPSAPVEMRGTPASTTSLRPPSWWLMAGGAVAALVGTFGPWVTALGILQPRGVMAMVQLPTALTLTFA